MEYAFLGLKPKEPRDKFESFGVVGEEVARYSVEFEPSERLLKSRVDFRRRAGRLPARNHRVDGNKDVAVIWLRASPSAASELRTAVDISRSTPEQASRSRLKARLFAVAHRRVENPDSIASSYSAR